MSRKGSLENNTYFPVRPHTPSTLIATLHKAGINAADKPLAMQARKARQSQLDEQPYNKNGTIVRHHAMNPEEIIEVIEKLDSPTAIIHQSERTKRIQLDGEWVTVPAPDNFAVFVTLDNGKECVAIVEFDSQIDKKYIIKDGHGEEYHTTVTVFEPDVERNGEPFDYIEYLLLRDGSRELEIVEKSPESKTAYSETHATVSETKLSTTKVAQDQVDVNKKFSNRDSDGNQLSSEQQEYFKDSMVRIDEDGEYWYGEGRLAPVYHATDLEFTTFLKKHMGKNTEKNANDNYLLATAYVGFWFNSSDPVSNGKMQGHSVKAYLNAKKLYNAGTLHGLTSEIWEGVPDNTSPKQAAKMFIDRLKWQGYDGIVIMDEEMGGVSFAVFESNQIKDVSNKKPTTKKDIRHSQRDVGRQEAVTQALEKENAKLREDVSELRELVKLQRQVTNGTKFTKTSVEAAARYLKQSANAKGSTQELMKLLNSLYEYIASGKELTWEGVKEQAQEAVDWLWEHIDRRGKPTEYAQDILKQLHGARVYLDESQMAEAAYRFGSYEAFRKGLMGSITLANGDVKKYYQQMLEEHTK